MRSLTLRSKLLLMLLPTSILSMGTVAVLGYHSGKTALTQQAVDKIVAMRAAKKQHVETYFRQIRDTFTLFSDDVAVVTAMSLFKDGFARLGRDKLDDLRRKRLEQFYRSEFLPALSKTSLGEAPLIETYWPRGDRTLEAQAMFIAENPNKAGARDKLLDHPVANPYTLAHFSYHTWFRELVARLRLYDLMLIDADTGSIIYTVAKEPDFATSLIDGPYANSNLGRLYRQVVSEHRKGYVRMSDFEFYAPSANAPAMFIAAPVYANFKLTGVMIGQLSVDEISRTMNGDKSWRQDGLGETGLAFIADPAMTMRNDHRMFIESKDAYLQRVRELGMPADAVEAMRVHNTTVLSQRINVEGVRRALKGETGTVSAPNGLGHPSLQAYAPLAIPDVAWVLQTQIDESEILAPQVQFQRNMMITACILALASTLAAMLLASRFLRPINALIGGINKLGSGQGGIAIAKTSDDEFGRLTDSFNTMSRAIKDRDDIIVAKNKAYEALLHRIFPDVVADRMKSGETQIVDSFSNVTVVYASIVGFVQSTQAMAGAVSIKVLNELIDTFDRIAGEHGVERVKTVGEHYIAACGLATPRLDHAQRAINFADAIADAVAGHARATGLPLDVRISLASGDIHAGLVGSQHFVFDIWGRPLNVARRLIHDAEINEIRICEETQRLIGTSSNFRECAPVTSKTLGVLKSFARVPLASVPAADPREGVRRFAAE